MRLIFILLLILIIAFSCVAPKDLTLKVNNKPINHNCPNIDYMIIAPRLNFNDWLPDFNKMINDIPQEVSSNQIGMSTKDEIKQEYWCFPSARPFVQIDTSISLKNSNGIIGLWRIKCCRTIQYKDSVSFKDSTFHRTSKLIKNDDSDDVLAHFTDSKLKIYVKTKDSKVYQRKISRHYKILNGRYLLIYNKLRTTSGTAFTGITKDNLLIWNQYSVYMDTYYYNFKRWLTNTNQMIFEKIE